MSDCSERNEGSMERCKLPPHVSLNSEISDGNWWKMLDVLWLKYCTCEFIPGLGKFLFSSGGTTLRSMGVWKVCSLKCWTTLVVIPLDRGQFCGDFEAFDRYFTSSIIRKYFIKSSTDYRQRNRNTKRSYESVASTNSTIYNHQEYLPLTAKPKHQWIPPVEFLFVRFRTYTEKPMIQWFDDGLTRQNFPLRNE